MIFQWKMPNEIVESKGSNSRKLVVDTCSSEHLLVYHTLWFTQPLNCNVAAGSHRYFCFKYPCLHLNGTVFSHLSMKVTF